MRLDSKGTIRSPVLKTKLMDRTVAADFLARHGGSDFIGAATNSQGEHIAVYDGRDGAIYTMASRPHASDRVWMEIIPRDFGLPRWELIRDGLLTFEFSEEDQILYRLTPRGELEAERLQAN